MSRSMTLPNPLHSGQAPSGLLKLYSRGSGGGYSMPQSSQANCELKPSRRHGRPSMERRRKEFGIRNSEFGSEPEALASG